MTSLTITIPALNEEKSILETTKTVIKAIQLCKKISKYELILIDDGSTDNTLNIMKELAKKNKSIKVISNGVNKGIGYCYKKGLQNACGEYCNWVPSDNPFNEESLSKFFHQIGNADIILQHPEIRNRAFYREAISYLYLKLLNFLFGITNIKYYNGLAVYKRNDLLKMKIRSKGFTFQAEILIKMLYDKKRTILHIPMVMKERQGGSSTIFKFKNIVDIISSIYFLYKEIKYPKNKNIPLSTKQVKKW